MKKILIKINDLSELDYPAMGFIFGIKNFSCCFDITFDIKDIIEYKNKYPAKEVYVSLNRVIFNGELVDYKKLLLELDKIGLNGVFVSDVAALTYNLKTRIILNQYHLNNSYKTINHYYNNGVDGIVLTNDITEDEVNYISKNSDCTLYKQVFGLPHLSTSRRRLVTNYLAYSKIGSNSPLHYIKEPNSDDYYTIYEDYFGTHIFGSRVLNLLDSDINLNVDYYILDSFLLDKAVCNKIISEYLNKGYINKTKVDALIDNDFGFNYRKTIYKVKNNE